MSELAQFPGGARIERGLADLEASKHTADALLVALASMRLREMGFEVPPSGERDPDLALYELLCREGASDPYYLYNAMRRELFSFLCAYAAHRARAI